MINVISSQEASRVCHSNKTIHVSLDVLTLVSQKASNADQSLNASIVVIPPSNLTSEQETEQTHSVDKIILLTTIITEEKAVSRHVDILEDVQES